MDCYHHHNCHRAATAAATCCCLCYYPTYTPVHNHHPPPLPDPHLHYPPHHPQIHSSLSHLPQYKQHFQEHYFHQGTQPHPTVCSLLRRIAALESALRRRSSHTSASQSLRDAAARTIQTHFRAFLSRRSRTLRQLKDLASIKSALGSLKSSVSEKTHFDYDAVYRKALKLLLKLGKIQGDDPMVRNGKSSISRELNKFLNFIEGISNSANVRYMANAKKSWVCNGEKRTGNLKVGDLKSVIVEKMRNLAERIDRLTQVLDEDQGEVIENSKKLMIRNNGVSESRSGVQPKAKKSVRFVENGKVYEVIRRRNEPFLEEGCSESVDGDDLVDVEEEIEDDLCRKIEEIGVVSEDGGGDDDDEEVHLGNEGSSDGEKDLNSY